jgi:Septum formation
VIQPTSLPIGEDPDDLATALAALERKRSCPTSPKPARLGRAQGRAILVVVLIGLAIGGAVDLIAATSQSHRPAAGENRASVVFSNAESGSCLSWPPNAPDKPSFVRCRDPHMFEVAKPVDKGNLGETCQRTVADYLGARYDPNSKFAVTVLQANDQGDTDVGDRNPLCGLQLPGIDGHPVPFTGRVAELDQSKVWQTGTCLGIDASNQSTDVPVDCASPHALEVVGAVNVADRFPDGPPSEPDQRAFIGEACTRAADAYLSPGTLGAAGLSLHYDTLSAESWSAGSTQVSCNIGKSAAPGWTPLVGDARTQLPATHPPHRTPLPSASEGPPPPVYQEPLIPLGPIPSEAPPSPTATSAPATTTNVPTTTVPPGLSPAPGPLPGPATPPAPGPLPGPATPPAAGPLPGPGTPPSESTGPQPGTVEAPGVPPITPPGPPPGPTPPAG